MTTTLNGRPHRMVLSDRPCPHGATGNPGPVSSYPEHLHGRQISTQRREVAA